MHFVIEDTYAAIIPESWPYKSEMVQISGVAEIVGGVGVLVPKTRKAAGKGLIALLVAVFPANINMTLNPEKFSQIPPVLLWARLPLQFAAIAWVYSATQRDQRVRAAALPAESSNVGAV